MGHGLIICFVDSDIYSHCVGLLQRGRILQAGFVEAKDLARFPLEIEKLLRVGCRGSADSFIWEVQ